MISRTRWQTLVAVALVVGTLAYAGMQWWIGRGNAPVPVPSTVPVALLLLAAVLFALGRSVRRFVQGKGAPVDPIRAFRIFVLAKASALAGAAQLGFFSAVLAVLAGLPDAPATRAQVWAAAAAAGACLVLVVVAMTVEWFCRVPPVEGDPDPSGTGGLA